MQKFLRCSGCNLLITLEEAARAIESVEEVEDDEA
jgi:hypothetical protein